MFIGVVFINILPKIGKSKRTFFPIEVTFIVQMIANNNITTLIEQKRSKETSLCFSPDLSPENKQPNSSTTYLWNVQSLSRSEYCT
ncbi:hypothetical protein ALC53_07502 [Atta colombica]|uniref:Uncharacterized protein n=1 Tax=Atta colombica TaxID=520822 RepID=A0A151I2Y0_9HYME|nr:hypothetical protein ALC53_07502 [Atta colombica]